MQVSVEVSGEPEHPALSESNDMRRIDFPCDPHDPIKVLETWEHAISCRICARAGAG